MRRLAIIGAGGHGQVVADAFLQARKAGALSDIGDACFLDAAEELGGTTILGLPVVAGRAAAREKFDAFVVAIGDNRRRKDLFERHAGQAQKAQTVRHPASTIADDVAIGEGTMVMAGVVVNTGSRIGRNTILNTTCSLDHHASIGDHVHIAPGVKAGGNVSVGEGALVGIGAVILPGVTIGSWAVVGAGAVVLRDVPAGVTVAGNPARMIKRPIEP